MTNPTWVGSPYDVRHGDEAIKALAIVNDSKYWVDGDGITKVDKERWEAAQKFERQGWMEAWSYAGDDRSAEHADLFDQYKVVPQNLGDVLEVGCGPFTQFRTISEGKTVNSLTLQDPLITEYLKHQNCWYANRDATLVDKMLEEYNQTDKFDTVICINVLEHVMDAITCLDNILNALRTNGLVIFGERVYDKLDVSKSYDVGHPICIGSSIVNGFKKNFEILYQKIGEYSAVADSGYFIGRKR